MGRSPVRHGDDAAEEEVLALVREHAGELLRFARRFSICADDAQDAYQRALEKLVRRMRDERPHNVMAWLRTVLRHEALEVRAERDRALGREQLDDDRHGGDELTDPAERVERFERLAHTAEALRRLKPQELTALVLRAEGLSYQEICDRTRWSYTRCNRAVTEGRRALRRRLEAIESGAECERWLPLLSMFADGEATAKEVADLRPHLRACAGCRATLRGFHEVPRQIGALVPVELMPAAVAVAAGGSAGGIGRHLEALVHGLLDRASVSVLRVQGAIDALPGAKLAAVAASTVAVAGGGAAIERAATAGVERSPAATVATDARNASSAGANQAVGAPGALVTASLPPALPAGAGTGPAAVAPASAAPPSEFGLEPASDTVAGPQRSPEWRADAGGVDRAPAASSPPESRRPKASASAPSAAASPPPASPPAEEAPAPRTTEPPAFQAPPTPPKDAAEFGGY